MANPSLTPIPEPPGLPLLGNLLDIDPEVFLASMVSLADKYGEIYRLRLGGKTQVAISSYRLVHEASDETRFKKSISAPLAEVRQGVNNGLFTATNDDPDWGIAHRVLMPAFGPMSIRGMFDEMHDIATQLTMKWARYGSNTPIMVTEDFTKLSLDTLALCTMNFRFNSYYKDELHPFISAMAEFLIESGNRSRRVPLPSLFYKGRDSKFFSDIEVLRKTATEVLQQRKEEGSHKRKDILSAMLDGVDPKTGGHMSDQSIIDNLITFLIAGHETTSGLLSFAFYMLLKHPQAYRKAQKEVDEVVGTGQVKAEQLSKLPYLAAILRETLRHQSPIPIILVEPIKDEVIGGQYFVPAGETIVLLLAKSHLDPAVYGDDVSDFKPERMLDDNFNYLNKTFPNCWKPFGNGIRSCIGRPFAWQEALLVMAMLLQSFNFVLDDPAYRLAIQQTLTIKPKGFRMRAILRDELTPTQLEHRVAGTLAAPAPRNAVTLQGSTKPRHGEAGKPLHIYYGSNSGTCEMLAHRLATDASSKGFWVEIVDCMDSANGKVPADRPVVFIAASYEGQPADNAALFVDWLQNVEDGGSLKHASYAVFGCGHRDWSSTFHRIPKVVDTLMAKHGGSRIAKTGFADAASGDISSTFEAWADDVFWPAMAQKYGKSEDFVMESEFNKTSLRIEISSPHVSTLRQEVTRGSVVGSAILTTDTTPVKKHMEIELPLGMAYKAGDYLAILPANPREIVDRAMRHFRLSWDMHLTIKAEAQTLLPTDSPIPAHDILTAYVELTQPATRRNILTLVEATGEELVRARLQFMASEAYTSEVIGKRVSMLDLLERHPEIDLPLSSFLSMLPPMRIRQYSIASSPLWNPNHVVLSYSVIDEPSLYDATKRRVGVATGYLSSLSVGDTLYVAVRPSHAAFHLPTDTENTPVIMLAAGTGVAPFRGFIQERAAMLSGGRKLARAILFVGCRQPSVDDIYRKELEVWEKQGAVSLRWSYSQKSEESEGCRYVQDRLWRDRDDFVKMWHDGAKVYVCGGRAMSEGIKEVMIKMRPYAAAKLDAQVDEDAKDWFESLKNVRYVVDVFD